MQIFKYLMVLRQQKKYEILINSSIDLISTNNPDQYVADYVATIIENKSWSIQRRRYANR
jgi:hypothetical protein